MFLIDGEKVKTAGLILFVFFFVMGMSLAQADTIVGIGMSNQAGGLAINKEMALARANDFLAEQANIANFRYRRDKGKVEFERLSKTDLGNIKILKSETFAKNGIIIWLTADVVPPRYTDERCQPVSETVGKGEQTNQILSNMFEKAIPSLLKPMLKKENTITGVSYIRKLTIKKTWLGNFNLKTDVCVAQLQSFVC